MIEIRSITVDERAVEAVVWTSDDAMRTATAPGLAERAVGLLPGLRRHSCDNDDGLDFTRELRDTETAHLLEHVACELTALAGSPRSLRGRTSWDFARDGRGVFRVSVEYDHDLVALAALDEALGVVRWLMGEPGTERPDVERAVERVAGMRGRE